LPTYTDSFGQLAILKVELGAAGAFIAYKEQSKSLSLLGSASALSGFVGFY